MKASPATWSPDGRRLAAVGSTQDHCSIAIYSTEPPYTTSQVVTLLDLPEFQNSVQDGEGISQSYCAIFHLAWSADGDWLAFHAFAASGGSTALYALSLTSLSKTSAQGGGGVQPIPVPLSMLTNIGESDGGGLDWPSNSNMLTYVDALGTSIMQFDVTTGATTTVLGPLPEQVCNLLWTPSGRQLVFVLCRAWIPETTTPPAQPYVFTPSPPAP